MCQGNFPPLIVPSLVPYAALERDEVVTTRKVTFVVEVGKSCGTIDQSRSIVGDSMYHQIMDVLENCDAYPNACKAAIKAATGDN